MAGAKNAIFSHDALKLIYTYTKGVPRLINTVCDNALLEGFLAKADSIDDLTVKTAAIDLGLSPESK